MQDPPHVSVRAPVKVESFRADVPCPHIHTLLNTGMHDTHIIHTVYTYLRVEERQPSTVRPQLDDLRVGLEPHALR